LEYFISGAFLCSFAVSLRPWVTKSTVNGL
jgi:hypothetical protein